MHQNEHIEWREDIKSNCSIIQEITVPLQYYGTNKCFEEETHYYKLPLCINGKYMINKLILFNKPPHTSGEAKTWNAISTTNLHDYMTTWLHNYMITQICYQYMSPIYVFYVILRAKLLYIHKYGMKYMLYVSELQLDVGMSLYIYE